MQEKREDREEWFESVNISDWKTTLKRRRRSCRRSLSELSGSRGSQSLWSSCWGSRGRACWRGWTRWNISKFAKPSIQIAGPKNIQHKVNKKRGQMERKAEKRAIKLARRKRIKAAFENRQWWDFVLFQISDFWESPTMRSLILFQIEQNAEGEGILVWEATAEENCKSQQEK